MQVFLRQRLHPFGFLRRHQNHDLNQRSQFTWIGTANMDWKGRYQFSSKT